jgi:hypothetical protein
VTCGSAILTRGSGSNRHHEDGGAEVVVIESAFPHEHRGHEHEDIVIELHPSDLKLSRDKQRNKARRLATEQMREKGKEPVLTVHPHAERLSDGVWLVRGWWKDIGT